jgi:hypothetical protein
MRFETATLRPFHHECQGGTETREKTVVWRAAKLRASAVVSVREVLKSIPRGLGPYEASVVQDAMERRRPGARFKVEEGARRRGHCCTVGLKQFCDNPRFRLPCQSPAKLPWLAGRSHPLARASCGAPCLAGTRVSLRTERARVILVAYQTVAPCLHFSSTNIAKARHSLQQIQELFSPNKPGLCGSAVIASLA